MASAKLWPYSPEFSDLYFTIYRCVKISSRVRADSHNSTVYTKYLELMNMHISFHNVYDMFTESQYITPSEIIIIIA